MMEEETLIGTAVLLLSLTKSFDEGKFQEKKFEKIGWALIDCYIT